jgi:hypothetical protein
VPLSELRTDLPPGLETTIDACLVPDAARRIANLTELSERLAPFGSSTARELAARIARVSGQSERARATAPSKRERSAWLIALGVMVAILVAALAVWLGR